MMLWLVIGICSGIAVVIVSAIMSLNEEEKKKVKRIITLGYCSNHG